MKQFSEFENWIEENGTSQKIGELASQTVMEFINTENAGSLTPEQQDVVFNFAIRVSSQVSAGLLQAYHEWISKQHP